MTLNELEAKLGAGSRRYLLAAYSAGNIRQYRMKDLNVTPEKMRLVVEAMQAHRLEINQQVKELLRLEKELSSLL
jgi:hypothetical protein